MSKGGSHVQETAEEKQNAQHAQDRWNERQNDGYVDLEKQQVANSTRDYSHLYAARNSADTAVAENKAYRSAAVPTGNAFGEVANTVGRSTALGQSDALQAGLKQKDATQLNVIKQGNDMAASTTDILGNTADMAGKRAAAEMQDQMLVNNARTNAVMTAIGGAVQGRAMGKAGYGFSFKDGLTRDKSKIKGYNPNTDPEPFQDREKLGYTPMIANSFGGR